MCQRKIRDAEKVHAPAVGDGVELLLQVHEADPDCPVPSSPGPPRAEGR